MVKTFAAESSRIGVQVEIANKDKAPQAIVGMVKEFTFPNVNRSDVTLRSVPERPTTIEGALVVPMDMAELESMDPPIVMLLDAIVVPIEALAIVTDVAVVGPIDIPAAESIVPPIVTMFDANVVPIPALAIVTDVAVVGPIDIPAAESIVPPIVTMFDANVVPIPERPIVTDVACRGPIDNPVDVAVSILEPMYR
jgi:hypothetical protein